jgi:hypothetical protein
MASKLKFIDQVMICALVVAAPMGIFWGYSGLAVCVGTVWGVANLFVLKKLVFHLFSGTKAYFKMTLLFFMKCPILYVIGYMLLKEPLLPSMYLFAGFSMIFVMMGLLGLKGVIQRA